MSRLNLTPWQRKRLRCQLQQTMDARLYRRTLAVLEFDRGRCAADIAAMLGVTRQSVHLWMHDYAHALDPEVLQDLPGRGRQPLLDEDDEHLLEAPLRLAPQDLGLPHTTWTVPLLQQALEVATGQRPSDDTLRRTLHRLDYVWKRPRYVLDPDPLREKKKTHPQASAGLAATQRGPRRGRDGPVALSAAARRLVQTRGGRQGVAQRQERSPRHLRGDEPAQRDTPVRAAPEGTQH